MLLRAYLMKSWATQVVAEVRVWSSVTSLNHVRIPLVFAPGALIKDTHLFQLLL